MGKKSTPDSDVEANQALRARSDRLKQLRTMAKVSRAELAKRCGLSPSIFSCWENLTGRSAKFGLPARSAAKVVEALRKDGIIATVEWLMFEKGDAPHIEQKTLEKFNRFQHAYDEELVFNAIQKLATEIDATKLKVHKIQDDTMSPRFMENDYVIGMQLDEKNWREIDCGMAIIELENEVFYLRKVRGMLSKKYTLFGTNAETAFDSFIIQPKKIISAYKIVAHINFG